MKLANIILMELWLCADTVLPSFISYLKQPWEWAFIITLIYKQWNKNSESLNYLPKDTQLWRPKRSPLILPVFLKDSLAQPLAGQPGDRKRRVLYLLSLVGPEWWSLPWGRLRSRPFSVTLSEPGFNSTWTKNFQMFKLDLEKAGEPEVKLPTSTGSRKKQESSRKTSASLATLRPFMMWITTNWKILKEMGIPDHLTCLLKNLYAGQEVTEPDMEQQIDSKLGKEYVKAVYCPPAYLTYI